MFVIYFLCLYFMNSSDLAVFTSIDARTGDTGTEWPRQSALLRALAGGRQVFGRPQGGGNDEGIDETAEQ